MTHDPVLHDDWHPVAAAAALACGAALATRLLDRELVVWRGNDGVVHAWPDRCPHRGTRLSLGRVTGDELVCAYHGWRYGGDGRCTHIPSQPAQKVPDSARVQAWRAVEHYGLVWASLGDPVVDVPAFAEHGDASLRKVVCGPYDVAASAPRIVENFLDMGHFGFVHGGVLGDPAHAAVADYEVEETAAREDYAVLATRCRAWQPQTNSLAHGGTEVEYTYRVVRPLTAILTKAPAAQSGFREAIGLHVQPVGEESSRVWIVLALTNFEQEDRALRDFQDRIFLQDRPILENQVPKRLPLAPRAELPVRADRMSMAYRRYLLRIGLCYGVERAAPVQPMAGDGDAACAGFPAGPLRGAGSAVAAR